MSRSLQLSLLLYVREKEGDRRNGDVGLWWRLDIFMHNCMCVCVRISIFEFLYLLVHVPIDLSLPSLSIHIFIYAAMHDKALPVHIDNQGLIHLIC